MRTPIIILCTLALLCSITTAAQKPNIVIILADDLGQSDLGCYGSTFHKTPHIDALAQRGMKFSNGYSASPLCSPTRASLLTGMHPARIGITAPNCHLAEIRLEKGLAKGGPTARVLNAESVTRLDTKYLTLPEVLRDAGWRTGHLGKWHLGAEPYSPLQQGFESDLPHTAGPGPGGGNGYFAPWSFWKGEGKPGDHIEDRMAEEAEKFINANKDRPFFLNYWAFSVHSPWMTKEDYITEAAKRMDKNAPQRNPMYAGMLRSLDDAVGRITAALEKNGVADNTIIIFTGDNGSWHNVPKEASRNKEWADVAVTSNAPFRSGKASNYEGGTRVPLLVVWPRKIAPASTSQAIVQSTDFFPTLLELAKVPMPAGVTVDGVNFATALRGDPWQRGAIFSHFPHGGRNDIEGFRPATWVRRDDWKLIRFYADNDDGSDKLELYNLREDVSETKDLASAKPDLAAELNALITTFLKSTEAVVPVRNPDFGKPAAAKPNAAKDPLLGWKARQCEASVNEGILAIKATAAEPFLGFAPGKLSAGATLHFRIKSDGPGKVAWLAAANAKEAPQPTAFTTKAGEWMEINAIIPATVDTAGIVRLYLPANAEVDWIEIVNPNKPPHRYNFGGK